MGSVVDLPVDVDVDVDVDLARYSFQLTAHLKGLEPPMTTPHPDVTISVGAAAAAATAAATSTVTTYDSGVAAWYLPRIAHNKVIRMYEFRAISRR